MFIASRWQRKRPRQTGPVQNQRGGGKSGDCTRHAEALSQIVLDTLVNRTKMTGKNAVLLAAESQKVIDECGEAFLSGERNARLADFVKLQIEVREKLGIGGIGSKGQCLRARRHDERGSDRKGAEAPRQPSKPVLDHFPKKLCHKGMSD